MKHFSLVAFLLLSYIVQAEPLDRILHRVDLGFDDHIDFLKVVQVEDKPIALLITSNVHDDDGKIRFRQVDLQSYQVLSTFVIPPAPGYKTIWVHQVIDDAPNQQLWISSTRPDVIQLDYSRSRAEPSIRTFYEQRAPARAIALSEDGMLAAYAGHWIWLWQPPKLQPFNAIEIPADSLLFSGFHLKSFTEDQMLTLDPKTGQKNASVQLQTASAGTWAHSPSLGVSVYNSSEQLGTVAISSEDGQQLWHTTYPVPPILEALPTLAQPRGYLFSPNGKCLVVQASYQTPVLDPLTGEAIVESKLSISGEHADFLPPKYLLAGIFSQLTLMEVPRQCI